MELQEEEKAEFEECGRELFIQDAKCGQIEQCLKLSCSQAFCSLRFNSQESPAWICCGDTHRL